MAVAGTGRLNRSLSVAMTAFLWILAGATASSHVFADPTILPFALLPQTSAPGSAADGLLHLRVKQRPIEEASSIQVTVKNIQVQKSGAPTGSDWVTVIEEEKTFDLVGLEQGEEVLAGEMLAEGLYTRVQLEVVSVKVTRQGQVKPAKVTGGRLKEIRSFEIDMAKVAILTLDFNVTRSLSVAESGEIQFKPVVRLLMRRGEPG